MGGGGRLSIEEGKHEHVSPEAPCVGQASESQGVQGVSVPLTVQQRLPVVIYNQVRLSVSYKQHTMESK